MFSRVVFVGLAACATAAPSISRDGGNPGDAQPITNGDAPPHGDAATSGCSFTGALATWDFSAQAGGEATVAAATTASGVTAGPVTRAAALTATAGAGSINSNNWPSSGALDSTKYYAFTIAPPTGCSLKLSSIAVDAKASGTGPANAVLATSADAFAATAAVSTSAPSSPTITVTSSTSLEIRLFGYSASATTGTLRVETTLTINGSIE
ncbi:MAG: hypothetical protein ABI591_30160 [Kofleriaceae bacterium]